MRHMYKEGHWLCLYHNEIKWVGLKGGAANKVSLMYSNV